ncbi:MAG: patatin-like phospholipase family protein [Burkholderiales bacterium]|nr:patatin-like phospholipase family protein [Burkholderiales bacterium]
MPAVPATPKPRRAWRILLPCLLAAALAGCSSARPWINQPLAADADPAAAAIGAAQAVDASDLSMTIAVTLSGGGARAAAFGYGVLDALRQTRVRWDGRDTSLLDEVDVISGVSGGSIVAAYVAAHGEQAFPAFEREFLRQDFQDSLISNMLKPASLFDLTSPWFGRTHLLARRLDELYGGMTFADLAARPGRPRLLVSATDLSLGASFEFSWEQFALICSDLGSVPLSFAVAASSAVPIVLSPVTLRNYSAQCPLRTASPGDEATPGDADYRLRLLRSTQRSYLDGDARPYIHLVDGGLADNLGVRTLLDRALAGGGIRSVTREVPAGAIRRLVIIAVNAERDPSERIDQQDTVPSSLQVADALLFGAGARATNETLGLLADTAQSWRRELSRRQGARDGFAADAQVHVVTVNLRDAPELLQPRLLLQVPTAFSIPHRDVDALIDAGRHILRQSPQFRQLIQSLGGELAPPP